MAIDRSYRNLPGTTIFDLEQVNRGYWLNQFCMSLMLVENRDRFLRDERAFLDEWPMSAEQREAVIQRDFNHLIGLGGNIYFLAKLGATSGLSFQKMASLMTGMSEDDYRAMMIAGGRRPATNASDADEMGD